MNPGQLQRLSEILSSLKSIVKCPICWDHIENTSELECSHRFCNTCLLEPRSKNSICPVCNLTIAKRASTFKDQFADELSRFTNRMCQLIKEKYAHEVDELCSKKKNLKEIIETAPQDSRLLIHSNISKGTPTIVNDNAFDRLIINSKKCYANKKKQIDQPGQAKVLSFNCNDTRNKIINWLSDNQKNLDILTQSPLFISDDEGDFEMPSVSQAVPFTCKNKPTNKNRSQSLTVHSSLQGPPMKRGQSFTEGLNDNDNYTIEEVQSEKLVKQVEKKVIQDLLEDECLANMDHVAQLDKENPNITPKKSKPIPAKNQTTNLNSSDSSSGWDRIKEVKRTIKNSLRQPNKLKITVQDANADAKKYPKRNTKKSPAGNNKNTAKTSHKRGRPLKSIGNRQTIADTSIIKDSSNKKNEQAFNLSTFEKFEQQAKDIEDFPETNSQAEINIIDSTTKDITELKQINENLPKNDKNAEIPAQSANENNEICHISPVPNKFNDIKMIATRLSDNLKSCLSSASNLQNEIGPQLVDCFTNLLTYAEKIIQIRSENIRIEMQTSPVSKKTGPIISNTIGTQTLDLPIRSFLNKTIQTSQNVNDDEAQTDKIVHIEQGIQTESLSQLPKKLLRRDSNSTVTVNQGELFTQSMDSKIVDELIAFEIPTSDSTKNQHISVDDSKENKSCKKSNIISQDSVLICSLNPTSISEKKPNRKLIFDGPEKRNVKRIRNPTSDSDSDDNRAPHKRKFVRDDLTIEFMETENVMKNDDSQPENCSTPECDKMDYDKYLLEVLQQDDSPPPKQKVPSSQNMASRSRRLHKKSQSLVSAPALTKSQRKSQRYIDSGEHNFTASVVLQENLGKFDQEILEFERTSKSYNTEFDLVENTPIASPRPKIARLSTKKREPMQPLQIISKGSACNNSNSKKCDSTSTEHNFTNLIEKDPSTLNRNIENRPSQIDKCSIDVADILEDLRNDEDFFKSNLECDEGEKDRDVSPGHKSNANCSQGGKINITQENIDEVLENLTDFNEDDDVEELGRINFTAEQKRDNGNNKIHILENIKLKSQDKPDIELVCVIDSSDDEGIVEATPQKRKCNSHDQSILKHVSEVENGFDNDALDVCLSPPPGFGDEGEHSPLPEVLGDISQQDNCPAFKKSSVTPDRLTDFIVTPDEKPQHTETEDTFIMCNRPAKPIITTPRTSQMTIDESEAIFSPIAKCSLIQSQGKYTPLVSTSRLATKKHSLMTSTPNQKSILNYVVPSQENPATRWQKSRPCIMWSRILNKDLNVFTQLENKKILTTSKVFGPQVTHLVVLVDEKGRIVSHTAKILQAIAAGLWVVRYEWTQDCLKMNRIVPEAPYEALDTTGVPGPQISRLSRATNPLFKGFKFYCAPPLKTVPKGDLESILQLSGGEIARDLRAMLVNDGKIHIILIESSATEETDQFETWLDVYKTAAVDVEWLTCCLGQYTLVSFRPYLISGDESMICDLGYPPKLVESVPFTLTEASKLP